jgi:SSS family solute:Na+ symporter
MNLSWIDTVIIICFLACISGAALYTARYTRTVADFLAASRSADRYLICVADGMAGTAVVSIVMFFEIYYEAGFPFVWWDMGRALIIPTILSLAGWVIYRFRQTRAFTLAQFFEMRYSRNFRVFAGFLAWFAGIMNFGIFPAVGAGFFIHFLGMPDSRLLYILLMIVLLGISVFFTFLGGHIAVMITDFIQGVFCNITFVIITVFMLTIFSWGQISTSLSDISASEASRIRPYHVGSAGNFNPAYYLALAFCSTYAFMAWQGSQGYNAAARNAHEARMGRSLNVFRVYAWNAFTLVVPICAYTFMHHADFASQSMHARNAAAGIESPTIRNQAIVVLAMRSVLPIGLAGVLCAAMVSAFIANCEAYLHSWGSIFIQDVVLPLRKTSISQSQHLKWLRCSILGVAVFILLFSIFFRQVEYITMFINVTGAIFTGGAGSVIIGGLYWKRATTAGAWAAMFAGVVISIGGFVLQQINSVSPFTNACLRYIARTNGMIIAFWAAVVAIISFILVSFLTGKSDCDMDKLLHRGKYARIEDAAQVNHQNVSTFEKLIGIDRDFTFYDKIIYILMVIWIALAVIVFAAVNIFNMVHELSPAWWLKFWHCYIWVNVIGGAIVTVWFGVGGAVDLKNLFLRLRQVRADQSDDGRVIKELEYKPVNSSVSKYVK